MTFKNRKAMIFITITVIVIVFLFALVCCNRKNNNEYLILNIMKQDEEVLHSLYEAPDICSKPWVIKYKAIGKTFFSYSYNGENIEIKNLLKSYQQYGLEIENIAIFIDENNYDDAVKKLKQLEATALKNEAELQKLYQKYYLKK